MHQVYLLGSQYSAAADNFRRRTHAWPVSLNDLGAIKQRWLKLRIDHVLPLAEAGNAHRMLEGRQTMGKIVLKVVD